MGEYIVNPGMFSFVLSSTFNIDTGMVDEVVADVISLADAFTLS